MKELEILRHLFSLFRSLRKGLSNTVTFALSGQSNTHFCYFHILHLFIFWYEISDIKTSGIVLTFFNTICTQCIKNGFWFGLSTLWSAQEV